MKWYIGVFFIVASIFINWKYVVPSEAQVKRNGVSGYGMKKEIKERARDIDKYVLHCEKTVGERVCIKPTFEWQGERAKMLRHLANGGINP